MARKKEILFVSHDANRAGAQIFLYNIMEYLEKQGYTVILLLVNEWGSFRENFEEKFLTYSLTSPPKTALDRFLRNNATTIETIKARHNIDLIYANTIASVHIIEELKATLGAPVITHIHELSYSISIYGVPNAVELLIKYSDKIIACSQAVADNLPQKDPDFIEVIHSFVNNEEILRIHEESDKNEIFEEFGLDKNYIWVASCGNADWRKAPDIFVQIAAQTQNEKIRFAWIGIADGDPLKMQLEYDAKKLGITKKIRWISPTPKAVPLIDSMDYFLLCSREDPFPLVMLEAALCEKPVFTFMNTGGGDEFVENDAGYRVPYLEVMAMADQIAGVTKENALKLGKRAQEKVLENYSFEKSVKKIEELIESCL